MTEREAEARNAVLANLRDPSRARFSDTGETAGGAVCGRVNSPNGYGGLTGPQRFIVPPGREPMFEELEYPDEFDAAWRRSGCPPL